MNARGDVFSSSTIHESLKNKLSKRDVETKVLNQKILENKKVQHFGCENETRELKCQIVSLQWNPIPQVVTLLYTSNDIDSREQ